ncbi:MAG: glycosyltransferase family 4 protein [Pseudomonadota bacterium]
MNIYYTASKYGSHLRVASCYRELIRAMRPLVDGIAPADVVILHHEPRDFGALYGEYPALAKKYVIGYCVWESDELPEAYKRSISHLQEVWTCSRYSQRAFAKYHPNVHFIPHVIERDTRFSPQDLDFIKQSIGHDPACTYFLTTALRAVLRKNVGTLVNAFQAVHPRMPTAKLIVKTSYIEKQSWNASPDIISLPDRMSGAQLNALYSLATAYVSAHHAEGWGLTLSDAMIFGKPVIATGYSGNLEYMNESNSLLVDYVEENIRPEDCTDLFHTGMKWAYPNENDLQNKLLVVHRERHSDFLLEKVRKAMTEIASFDRASVMELIRHRLDDIAASCL